MSDKVLANTCNGPEEVTLINRQEYEWMLLFLRNVIDGTDEKVKAIAGHFCTKFRIQKIHRSEEATPFQYPYSEC
jgi:hypothetical protein